MRKKPFQAMLKFNMQMNNYKTSLMGIKENDRNSLEENFPFQLQL